MEALVLFVTVVSIPCLIWFLYEINNAPEGYEDGYHNVK